MNPGMIWNTSCSTVHAAITMRLATIPSKTSMVLRPQLVHEALCWNLLDIAGTILHQSTIEFCIGNSSHQQHLQSHLHCGNDPTVAKHNGIPSATPPPAPLAIPFTLRERSYSCKSQWNSVDRTCTKNRWNPIYNAEPIRAWSDHDPSMIRPHTRPSRTRRTAEVDHRGSGTDFVWKNIGFRASAISQKRISCETSFKNPTWRCHLQLTLSLTNSFFD